MTPLRHPNIMIITGKATMPDRPINMNRHPLNWQAPHILLIPPLRVHFHIFIVPARSLAFIRIISWMTRGRNRQATTRRHRHRGRQTPHGQSDEAAKHQNAHADSAQHGSRRVAAGDNVATRVALHILVPRLDAHHKQTFGDEPVHHARRHHKGDSVAVGNGEEMVAALCELRVVGDAQWFAFTCVVAPFDRYAHRGEDAVEAEVEE